MKKLLLVLISLPLVAAPQLVFENGVFFVEQQDGSKKQIQRYDMDEVTRHISTQEDLTNFLKNGHLQTKELSDGSYVLAGNGNLNGGGPVLGWIAYGAVKVVACAPMAIAHLLHHKKHHKKHHDSHSNNHRVDYAVNTLERVSDAVHVAHGHGADVAFERGAEIITAHTAPFLVNTDRHAGDEYIATAMMVDPATAANASMTVNSFADAARQFCNALPGW